MLKKNNGILIVGGGLLQSYAIKKARENNLKVYLSDGDVNCFSKNLADEFYLIDTKDYKKTSEIAKNLVRNKEISGVYTQGTDVAFTVAYAAKQSGLPGLDPDIALSTENKIIMREKLFKTGIDKTKFMVASTLEDLDSCKNLVGFPCYVKPADNSGSRGVSRVIKQNELKEAFNLAKNNNIVENKVLIEQEIIGDEFSIDTVVVDNTLYNAGISDRIFNKKDKYAIQGGSLTPSLLPEEKQHAMIELMERIADKFQINNSALKGDLIIDENGVIKVIEIAARTSGGFDSQVRKPTSFGIDLISLTMELSLNKEPNINHLIPKWFKWSKTISIFPSSGIVKSIIGENWLEENNEVVDSKILVKKGDHILDFIDCGMRNNYITFKANTFEELVLSEKDIRNNFKIIMN